MVSASDVGSIPVDGICVNCGRVEVHRVSPEKLHPGARDIGALEIEPRHLCSFETECVCKRAPTWHNAVAVLSGVLRGEVAATA